MTRTPQDNKLHTALIEFVVEAMSYLRKATDVTQLPTIARFELREARGHKQIAKVERPNWWQVGSYMNPVLGLSTFKDAVEACFEHPLVKSREGRYAWSPIGGTPFSLDRVPWEFLTECIVREDGLKFRRRTFEIVFCDLFSFLASGGKNLARLIAPLDMLRLDGRQIPLGPNARVRPLSSSQIVDLANHCSILRLFYGHEHYLWFSTVLELDFTFEWLWFDEEEGHDGWSRIRQIQDSQQPVRSLTKRLMEEMILLRCLLKKQVSSPTYVIDYRGWNSVMSSGGQVQYLPWVRPSLPHVLDIQKSEFKRFTKFREKFLSIQDEKIKRRIFAAMRRLSSTLERHYAGDILLDAVAGLEGLLVNEDRELRHQFAEHAALLLETQPAKRVKLFQDMRSAYDLRSRVGHGGVVADDLFAIMGGDKPIKGKELQEFNAVNRLSRRCSELLHKAIMICIDREKVDFDWVSAVMSGGRVT